MPEDNRATKHFKELNLTAYTSWYDNDILKYLVHSAPKAFPHLRYVFTYASRETFLQEFQQLVVLSNDLKQPALFICVEPGRVNVSHFVVGVFYQGQLAIINPVGLTAHRDFYQILQTLYTQGLVNQFYLSKIVIQRDPNGLMSCGPLCGELLCHFSQLPLQTILSLFQSNEVQVKEGIKLGIIDIGTLLPANLQPYLSLEGEAYQQTIEALRWEHQGILEILTENEAECALNDGEQMIMAQLVVERKTIIDVREKVAYQRLAIHSHSAQPRSSTVQSSLFSTTREERTDFSMSVEDLFNFCMNMYYEQDLEILKTSDVFIQPITCYVYHAKENKQFLAEIKELAEKLTNYKIDFKLSEDFRSEAEFIEKLNKSGSKAILVVTPNFLADQTPLIQPIWQKAQGGDIVPFLIEDSLKVKLHPVFNGVVPINGTSPYLYEKLWNIVNYLYKNTNNYDQALRMCKHRYKIKNLSQFFKNQTDSTLMKELLNKYAYYLNDTSKAFQKELFEEIDKLVRTSESVNKKHLEDSIKKSKAIDQQLNEPSLDNSIHLHNKKMLASNPSYSFKESSGFAIGNSDFKSAIESGCLIIDKSLFIKDIIDDPSIVKLIIRPRRFGKTFNMSMLYYFFSNFEDNKSLFNELKIGRAEGNYIKEQGQYPVIFLTFKNVKNRTFTDSFDKIKNIIAREYKKYKTILLNGVLRDNVDEKKYYQNIIDEQASRAHVGIALKNLSQYLYQQYRQRVIILIDEYDTPVNASHDFGYYDVMMEFIRDFLGEALKDNEFLSQAVLTGILRVAKESIFSGLNNIKIYSVLCNQYAPYFGFTLNEIKELYSLNASEVLFSKLSKYYGGYQFGNQILFNPWSTVNYLNNYKRGEPQFGSYWINTAGNEIVEKQLNKPSEAIRSAFKDLISNKAVEKIINEHIVFNEIETEPALWSFLLLSGYLTAKVVTSRDLSTIDYMEQNLELFIPNQELYLFYKKIVRKWFPDEPFSYKFKSFLLQDVQHSLSFAIGNSDFETMVKRSYQFIDKSLLIKEIIDDKTQVKLIIRPRRFGKTLNMTMLKSFFNCTKQNKRHLFQDLKIWQAGEAYRHQQGQYPVIFLTFKDIKARDYTTAYQQIKQFLSDMYSEFETVLLDKPVLKPQEYHQFNRILHKQADKAVMIGALKRLTSYLHRCYQKPVMILIDEYDTPIYQGYMHGYYENIVGFIHNFLGTALKDNEKNISQAILTGTLCVAKESIFSGLNNIRVYSHFSEQYSPYFGFTLEEVTALLSELDFPAQSRLLTEMEKWYGGYRKGKTILFNPWSITNFIQDNINRSEGDWQFQSYWLNTLDDQWIKKLLVNNKRMRKFIIELTKQHTIRQVFRENIVINELMQNADALCDFLLLSGYLTTASPTNEFAHSEPAADKVIQLAIPNEEVRHFYQKLTDDLKEQEKLERKAMEIRVLKERITNIYSLVPVLTLVAAIPLIRRTAVDVANSLPVVGKPLRVTTNLILKVMLPKFSFFGNDLPFKRGIHFFGYVWKGNNEVYYYQESWLYRLLDFTHLFLNLISFIFDLLKYRFYDFGSFSEETYGNLSMFFLLLGLAVISFKEMLYYDQKRYEVTQRAKLAEGLASALANENHSVLQKALNLNELLISTSSATSSALQQALAAIVPNSVAKEATSAIFLTQPSIPTPVIAHVLAEALASYITLLTQMASPTIEQQAVLQSLTTALLSIPVKPLKNQSILSSALTAVFKVEITVPQWQVLQKILSAPTLATLQTSLMVAGIKVPLMQIQTEIALHFNVQQLSQQPTQGSISEGPYHLPPRKIFKMHIDTSPSFIKGAKNSYHQLLSKLKDEEINHFSIASQVNLSSDFEGLYKTIETWEFNEVVQRSFQEKLSDHEGSLWRLAQLLGFKLQNVPGDGRCFFHAVLHQLQNGNLQTQYKHWTVQDLILQAVQYMIDHQNEFEGFIEKDLNTFIAGVMENEEWAEDACITALSKALNINLIIINSDHSKPIAKTCPHAQTTVYLGYEVEWHYQSLVRDSSLQALRSIEDYINNFDASKWQEQIKQNFGEIKAKKRTAPISFISDEFENELIISDIEESDAEDDAEQSDSSQLEF